MLTHFPWAQRPFLFRAMTVERPTVALRHLLTKHGYVYLRDHGCFGDSLWVHGSLAATAEAALGLVPWDADLAHRCTCPQRNRGVRRGEAPPQPSREKTSAAHLHTSGARPARSPA